MNTTMHYKTHIDLPFGQLRPMIEWCQNHCTKDWRFDIVNDAGSAYGSYRFEFESEKDFMTFLVWKK